MLDFLKKQTEQTEKFWALLIEPEWITSAIWQIEGGKVDVIATSPATRWDPTDDKIADLIEVVDTSLSACTQNLPEDFPDPTKTVFGVPNSWIESGNIKDEYLEKLKKLCDDLSLVPSGFVVLSEAISHFIKQEEETSLSGIVIGVSGELLDLSIFELGKLIGTTSVARSISIEDDVIEGISRLSGNLPNLPSRIILFNQKKDELEIIKNSLNDTDWGKVEVAKFIHPPKIEILDPDKKILSVALAGGSELGEISGIITINNENENMEVENDTVTETMPLEEVNNFEEPEGITAEDLGFTIEPHVSKPNVQEAEYVPVPISRLPKMPKFDFKKPNFKMPNFKFMSGNKPLIMGGSLIVTLFFVGFILWWFLPKAVVTIYVTPTKLEENILLTIGSDISTTEVEVSVGGEKTKPTTGTKVVGEKAKGSVKIQNGTAFPINLPTGTVLISSSDLKFVTIKTASVSGALSPSTPGTATVDIEAGNIGSEFNLSKDEVFKVGNYPKAEVDGTTQDGFTGGSSRQISSVAEGDRKKLLNELTDELVEEAKIKLNEKINEGSLLIETSFINEVEEENYSNKIGDEATNIKLSLTIKVTSFVVSKKDLSDISKKNLEDRVPTGFVLRDDQIQYDFRASDENNNFDVKVSANLLPSINTEDIAKQISGKYPNIAEEFLTSVPGFVNAEIRMKPVLRGKLGTLPHLSKNITIEVAVE